MVKGLASSFFSIPGKCQNPMAICYFFGCLIGVSTLVSTYFVTSQCSNGVTKHQVQSTAASMLAWLILLSHGEYVAKTAVQMTSHDLHVVAITGQACAVLSCQLILPYLPIVLSPHERVSREIPTYSWSNGLRSNMQTK